MADLIKKGIMMHVVIAVLCALVSFVGGVTFGVIMGALIFAAYLILMYAEGCSAGEHACTVRDTIAKLDREGKKPDDKLAKQTYNTKKALIACACISLPLALLAIVNLIFADPDVAGESVLGVITRVAFLPFAFITRLCSEMVKYNTEGVSRAAVSVISAFQYGSVDVGAILNGNAVSGMYAFAYDLKSLTIMRICYIVGSFMPAAAMLIGYLRGPKLRENTLKDMMKGTRKKQKKLKVFGKPKQARQAKPEI